MARQITPTKAVALRFESLDERDDARDQVTLSDASAAVSGLGHGLIGLAWASS